MVFFDGGIGEALAGVFGGLEVGVRLLLTLLVVTGALRVAWPPPGRRRTRS
jgi:hypothetical protein